MKTIPIILILFMNICFIGAAAGVTPQQMLKFIKENNTAEIKKLILQKAKLDFTLDSNETTPLMCAVAEGKTDIAKIFVNGGANVNASDKSNRSAIFYAVFKKNKEIIKELLNKNADINILDADFMTPLLYAIDTGDNEIIKALADSSADIDFGNDGFSPLIYAIYKKNNEAALYLIEKGADIKIIKQKTEEIPEGRIIMMRTPLITALRTKNTEMADILLKRGIALNNDEYFWLSLVKGSHGDIKNALDDGAMPNQLLYYEFDAEVNYPLQFAIETGKLEIVKLLVEYGADVNLAKTEMTPLCYAAKVGYYDIAEYLIGAGAEPDKIGDTPFAAVFATPLYYAVKGNSLDIAELLREKGANINTEIYDNLNGSLGGILMNIIDTGSMRIVKYLLETGVDINQKDYAGNTALVAAIKNNNIEMVKYLVNSGAKTNIKINGKTGILEFVNSKKMKELADYLKSIGIK